MEVSPNILEFKGNFLKPNTNYLTLKNNSDTPLAFKVKTTAPKLYCVRPNASIVAPGETMQVSIILQGFVKPLPSDYKCKDKFLLVSLPCPDLDDASKLSENWSSLEATYKSQEESKKLKVNYIISDEEEDSYKEDVSDTKESTSEPTNAAPIVIPPTPSQNKSVENSFTSSNGMNGHNTNVGVPATEAANSEASNSVQDSELNKDLDASNVKVNKLSSQFDHNEEKSSEPQFSQKATALSEEPSSGISMTVALVLMLISFLLGWLMF